MSTPGDSSFKHIDTRGDYCPTPIIKLAEAVRALEAGASLVILSDDPGFEFDLPLWCKSTGNRLVSMETSKGTIHAVVQVRREAPR